MLKYYKITQLRIDALSALQGKCFFVEYFFLTSVQKANQNKPEHFLLIDSTVSIKLRNIHCFYMSTPSEII